MVLKERESSKSLSNRTTSLSIASGERSNPTLHANAGNNLTIAGGRQDESIRKGSEKPNEAQILRLQKSEKNGTQKSSQEISTNQPTNSSTHRTSGRKGKKTQGQLLIQLASNAELFHTPGQDFYATVPVNGHFETFKLSSKQYKNWLGDQFYNKYQKPADSRALDNTIRQVETFARKGPTHPVYTRLGGRGEKIFLDLVNKSREVIEISENGWKITKKYPVKFRRPKAMLPLPYPKKGSKIDVLKEILNVSQDDFKLLVAFLLGTLMPKGPYPILLLVGEQGSAKSTVTEFLRKIVDPNESIRRSPPKKEKTLMITATNSWIVSYDNVSYLTDEISDALCRLSTGGGFTDRVLYTDDEEKIFNESRPCILNGIDYIATRSDLIDRAISIRLPKISESDRLEERELWKKFHEVQPLVLGALLDATSHALRTHAGVKLDKKPRMADFARWVTAAEEALGWENGEFLKAYWKNIEESNVLPIETDPVGQAAIDFMEGRKKWRGRAEELLSEMRGGSCHYSTNQKGFPTAGNILSKRLMRLAPNLRRLGLNIDRGKDSDRFILIERIGTKTDDTDDKPTVSEILSSVGSD